jgi:superfamily II DNA/RNA helicase
MKLKEEILRGIYEYGFEKNYEIKKSDIIKCVKGNDVIDKEK